MGSHLQDDTNQPRFGDTLNVDDWGINCEQYQMWFLGSLMRAKDPHNDFTRLATLHNQITYDATRFTEHFQKNIRISSLLSEFFHTKWLLEIVAILRTIDPNHLGIRTHAHRV
ncbi:MAG: hypothetical protein ACFFB5_06185 [Promethearchaeota archaeon]